MGCCYSTNKPSPPSAAAKQSSISKSPPPTSPLAEEETVKEVLSETPSIPKIPPPAIPIPNPNLKSHSKVQSPFIKTAPLLRDFPRLAHNREHQNGVVCRKPFAAADDVSDVSEICSSLSESISAATSETKPELRERRLKNRPFSGEINRERTVGRSPGRRPDPSPNRVRPGNVRRRENGESSGRRSRSPATRADKPGLERTHSVRKTGKSPGRVGSGLGERIRKVDGDNKWPPTSSNELLENPLVSLECFIFL